MVSEKLGATEVVPAVPVVLSLLCSPLSCSSQNRVFHPHLKTSLHSHSTFAPLNNNVNSFNKKRDKMQLCFRYRQKIDLVDQKKKKRTRKSLSFFVLDLQLW